VILAQEFSDFSDMKTWCGGLLPDFTICEDNGGCDIIVPAGVILSITKQNDQLSLPVTKWIISGTLNSGSSDLETGFYFGASCQVLIQDGGSLIDKSTGDERGIYFPFDSRLVLYPGVTFKGQGPSFVLSYQLGDFDIVTASAQFGTAQSPDILGPFTIVIDITGSSITSFPSGIYHYLLQFN
jgi:hypothetical protein